MSTLYLKRVSREEVEQYRDKWQSCMVGEAQLTDEDIIVLAMELDEMYHEKRAVAMFTYNEVTPEEIENFCIIRLVEDKYIFRTAFSRMIKHFRWRYTRATTYVEKNSHLVKWCDKLYKRVGEDEDSYQYDIMKLKRR